MDLEMGKDATFSIKSAYEVSTDGGMRFVFFQEMWRTPSPMKVQFWFGGLLMEGQIST